MSRRAYKTPGYEGSGRICRPLFIPDDQDWLAAVGGALAELTRPYNWEDSGGIRPLRAAEIAAEMLKAFYEGECGDNMLTNVRQSATQPCILEKEYEGVWLEFADLKKCVPAVRVGANGTLEVSADGGLTWEEADMPVPPVAGGSTPNDKRCIAAASATEVIDLAYREVIRQWESGARPLAIVAGLIAILATIIFFQPAALAVLDFVMSLIGVLDELAAAAGMDASTKERLINILYCASSEANGVVTFNFTQALDEVNAEAGVPFDNWHAIAYMLHIVGEDGLNRAGATGVIQSPTCDDSECPDEWCYEFDFQASAHGFSGYPSSSYMTQVGGLGLRTGSFPNGTNVYTHIVHGIRQFSGLPVKRIEFDMTIGTNAPNGNFWIRNNHANLAFAPKVGGLHTYVWSGQINLQLLGIGANNWNTTAGNYHYIHRLRLYGDGSNPFGQDNC